MSNRQPLYVFTVFVCLLATLASVQGAPGRRRPLQSTLTEDQQAAAAAVYIPADTVQISELPALALDTYHIQEDYEFGPMVDTEADDYDHLNASTNTTKSTNTTRGLLQTTTTPWWTGKLVVGDNQLSQGFAKNIKTSQSANNKAVVVDPFGSGKPVLRVRYTEGCWSPSSGCGGVLFNAWPYGSDKHIGKFARLEYEVYIPRYFPWVKGGKFPGLAGGDVSECGGGEHSNDCWSVRIMWRAEGAGEAYLYIPKTQASGFCSTAGTKCDTPDGISFMRGAWTFKTGAWTKVSLTIKMNDLGKANGLLRVGINGVNKISYDKMVYRVKDLQIDNLLFASWFGGSDDSWSPPRTTQTYFRNIRIYKS